MQQSCRENTVVLFCVFSVVNKSHGFLHVYKCVVDFYRLNVGVDEHWWGWREEWAVGKMRKHTNVSFWSYFMALKMRRFTRTKLIENKTNNQKQITVEKI